MPSNYSRCFKAGPPGLTQAHQQLSRVTTDDEYLLTTSDVAPPVGVRAEAFRIRVSRNESAVRFVLQATRLPRRKAGRGEVRPRRVMMATSIGIMDGAYFVGRDEILHCINATFQLSLAKVQEDVL
jgi:hypothetical protein